MTYKYPIYKRWRYAEFVVKFTDLTTGGVVINRDLGHYDIGQISNTWPPHTHKNWTDWSPNLYILEALLNAPD